MLISLLSNAKNIAMGVLLILTLLFGWMSYSFNNSLGKAEEALAAANFTIESLESQRKMAEDSCKLTESISAAITQQNIGLQNALGDFLEDLSNVPEATPQVENNNDKIATPRASNRLSPELMRVLDSAYCTASKDTGYCPAR